MLIQREDMLDQIQDSLAILKNRIKISTVLGRTDMNKAAEDFYCGLLNIILGGFHLKNLNLLQMDFPAIDLADEEHRLCVQVTSTNDKKKIESTLQKFFENGLQHRFDRLIVLIIGDKKDYRKAFAVESGFDFDRGRDIWDTARLVQEINKLDDTAFGEVHAYLRSALNIPDASVPLHLPLHTSLGVDGFVGRQEELRALEKAIADYAKPIILSGLGGMGKTELATHFGRRYGGGNVYLASFQKSFRETVTQSIAKGIPDLLEKKLLEDEVYKTVMNRLGQCVKDDILILDNVDRDTGSFADLRDDAYDDLCGLGMHLIMTTRFDVPRAIEIRQLSNSELHRIFQKHKVTITAQEMDALIQAVDGHTLTIDLMARTMNSRWKKVTADMLLKALQDRNLPDQDFRKISTDYNRSKKQERIYEHLRTVFNVAGVHDAAKSVLCYATLLPQDGMDAETFGTALQEEEQQALDDLIDHGWLAVKDDILTIHPVVRLVCREELKPSDEKCTDFLDSLWYNCQIDEHYIRSLSQLASIFTSAADNLSDHSGAWAHRAGDIWDELSRANQQLTAPEKLKMQYKSLTYRSAAFEKESQTLPLVLSDIAASFSKFGVLYGYAGNYEKALEYEKRALSIKEQIYPPDHPDIAVSYTILGNTLCSLRRLSEALECQELALAIRQKALPENHHLLAQSYNNLCLVYGYMHDYPKALECQLLCLYIAENCLPEGHVIFAIMYNNLGSIYSGLKQHHKAISYQKKALDIYRKQNFLDYPAVATCNGNIAVNYIEMEEWESALVYLREAISIAEQILVPDHPEFVLFREHERIVSDLVSLQKKGIPFQNPYC